MDTRDIDAGGAADELREPIGLDGGPGFVRQLREMTGRQARQLEDNAAAQGRGAGACSAYDQWDRIGASVIGRKFDWLLEPMNTGAQLDNDGDGLGRLPPQRSRKL
ncbi:protein of unknown function [Candidatus Filomicrobium marinum]|nr:protein of unknown function [Candidatus Filomicrobium marinum]